MPQTKRLFVTLDPDYIPWEHNEDVVALRHKRLPRWMFAVVGVIGIIILAVVNQAKTDRQLAQQQSAAAIATATPAPLSIPPGLCEYGGVLLPPGIHTIGDRQRECKNGEIAP